MKRSPRVEENICKIYLTKHLHAEYTKELSKLNNIKTNNPVKKRTKDLNQ